MNHRLDTTPSRVLALILPQWPNDPTADMVAALSQALVDVIPGWRVISSRAFAITLRGATRFYGSEIAVATAIHERLQAGLDEPYGQAQIGIADTLGAARIFAHGAQLSVSALNVPSGASPSRLAPLDIGTLELLQPDTAELVSMLQRLGVNTLRAFADLDSVALAARFGQASVALHNAVCCTDTDAYNELSLLTAAHDHTVQVVFEPELTLPEQVAFSCVSAAETLVANLFAEHLVCTEITVTTVGAHTITKQWQHASWFRSRDIVDRVRWQLAHHSEATSTSDDDPELQASRESISAVIISPKTTESVNNHQPGLLGGHDDGALQDTIARLQSLHQYDAVLSPRIIGGRLLHARTQLTPFGQQPAPAQAATLPWPGHLPKQTLPTTVPRAPALCAVHDADNQPVTVTERGELSAVPAIWIHKANAQHIHAWWGPWELYEKWWTDTPVRYRIQVVTDSGSAALLIYSAGNWYIEGTYS